MKKTLISVLLIITVLLLIGCDNTQYYEPVASTEEEARTVMTVKAGNNTYEIRYELYRALFLSNRDTVDGGDTSVWQGENAEQYIEEINRIICAKAYKIYSAIELARSVGFDPYSSEVETAIKDYVKGAVEGDDKQLGHGSYEKYLASLKQNNMNYSVAVLIMRYNICMSYINEYYGGTVHETFDEPIDGQYEYTREDVKEFYNSDSSRRFMQIFIDSDIHNYQWADKFRNKVMSFDADMDKAIYIISATTVTEADFIYKDGISGTVLGEDALDSYFYADYLDKIFETEPGQMSEIIKLENTESDGYYLIYGLEKSDEHFERCYEHIRDAYIDNVIGSRIESVTDSFDKSLTYTDDYKKITHSEIKMD